MKKYAKQRVLVTRPDFETATHWGQWHFLDKQIAEAKRQGLTCFDLYAEQDIKTIFAKTVDEQDPVFICGVGHGNPSCYTGQNYDILLDRSVEAYVRMKDRCGSFLSCEWGQSAKQFVDMGCLGFFGYTVTYYFCISTYPNQVAEWFFGSHAAYDFAILRGKSQKEAFDECVKAYNAAIAEADPTSCRYLVWDRDGMTFQGDGELHPYPHEPPPPPKEKCCKCAQEFDSCGDLVTHVVYVHGPSRVPCWLPSFIRKWLGCPLD